VSVARLEILGPGEREMVALDGERVVVGKSSDADVVIDHDTTVSRRHAVLERVGGSWAIRDLGSTNGTLVNGDRVFGDRALRDGDEIMLGRTRVVYRVQAVAPETSTEAVASAPAITRREKDVLVELCRPLLSGSAFTPPATVRDIAERLFVTESDVKGHLARLYDKFQIDAGGERRVYLANAALQTGAVTFADLRSHGQP
jgi:pSer/pThr/pTyr-binding forkhead associated (FHA) protein